MITDMDLSVMILPLIPQSMTLFRNEGDIPRDLKLISLATLQKGAFIMMSHQSGTTSSGFWILTFKYFKESGLGI